MRRLWLLLGVSFALVVPATTLTAQDVGRGKERKLRFLERRHALQVAREARGFRRLQVDGAQVRPATEKLAKELKWHRSLKSAQREARRTGKPIVWIHALGDLTGVL